MQWAPIGRECRNSGMAVRAWCLQNNVNEKQFYCWQRRVREEVFNTLKKIESQSQPKFVQLQTPSYLSNITSSFSADMVIHIGNNVLELSNTISEDLLAKVLKVLSNVK